MVKITFCSAWDDEETIDFLSGYQDEDIMNIKNSIHNCTCGSDDIELAEIEGMGYNDYVIKCRHCDRLLVRSLYDIDIKEDDNLLDICIKDWNNGLTANDIQESNKKEQERLKLTEDALVWKELYPNNMPDNGLDGYYCLLFKKNDDDTIYGCKFTIEFQREEYAPMAQYENAKIESYNLFHQRYFKVEGNLYYPAPANESTHDEVNTLSQYDVNNKGDFIRNYKTLEEAKLGALARCGWQGLNNDTIITGE